MAGSDLQRLLTLSIQAVVVIVVIAIVAGAITAAGFTEGSASVNATTDHATTLDGDVSEVPSSVTVRATTEYALAFDGNHSVDASTPVNATNGSWTACATVELGDSADTAATYDVLAYANETMLLQYDAGQWSVYYSNGTHDGLATVDAPTPSDGLTPICARYNASANELRIVREQSYSAPVALTSTAAARNVSWQWIGRQDEVRWFGNAVTNATINEYADDPVRPQPDEQRLARFMFDEGGGDTTTVYFADTTVSVAGLSWAGGVTNPRKWLGLASAIDEGDDYVLTEDPFGIRLVARGYLDGAPVVHVSWADRTLAGFLLGFIPVLLGLLVIVVVANEVRTML